MTKIASRLPPSINQIDIKRSGVHVLKIAGRSRPVHADRPIIDRLLTRRPLVLALRGRGEGGCIGPATLAWWARYSVRPRGPPSLPSSLP